MSDFPTYPQQHWVSDQTEEKERHFASLLRMHMRICKGIMDRRSITSPYLYADLHAGPGHLTYNGRRFLGSPLIFLDLAEEILGASAESLLFEQDLPTAKCLRAATHERATVVAESCESGMASWLDHVGRHQRDRFGLVYSDPIGKPIPVDLLQKAARTLPKVDILSYTSATAYKRTGRPFLDDVKAINKRHVVIRRPHGAWQWTFILWSNWVDYPAWQKAGFYALDSEMGRSIMDHLNLTAREREAKMSTRLPFADSRNTGPTPSISGIPASGPSARKPSNEPAVSANGAAALGQLSLITFDTRPGESSTSPRTSSPSATNATANSKERSDDALG